MLFRSGHEKPVADTTVVDGKFIFKGVADEDLVYQEIALYKLSTELFIKMGTVEGLIRKYNARILEMNETCVVLEKSGHYDETQALFNELSETIGVLQFIRSGRVAITKSKVERLSDMLADMERKLHEKQQ